jgi:coenzyme F420-0:L-glutamate ligase/coenzyme F420-1:gamma-L-glutamate ligase
VSDISCAPRLVLTALDGLPIVRPGDDVAGLILAALTRTGIVLAPGDVLVVTSKVFSRAEGRFVDLTTVAPSPRAVELAARVGKDARVVELVLRESTDISRTAPDTLIVRHRLGFVSANAGIDASNARPPDAPPTSGPWVLLLPASPDASAARVRDVVRDATGVDAGVVVTDSHGRPFRHGTVGVAVGVAGLPALWDQRGTPDLHGRALETTVTALADQVAAAADLVAGQAAEGRAVIHVRGLAYPPADGDARALVRTPERDLYA